jgi:hypothetical protein
LNEGILTELASAAVGTNNGEETAKDISRPQSELIIGPELFAPLVVEMLGKVPRRMDVTSVVQVLGGATGQLL